MDIIKANFSTLLLFHHHHHHHHHHHRRRRRRRNIFKYGQHRLKVKLTSQCACNKAMSESDIFK
jgi:hypothetical protein